jgi:hypothetical protein
MKVESFLLALIFGLTPLMWAQEPQAPPPGGSQAGGEHRQQMTEIHQQEMEAMKADIQKMKSALAQMKANLLTIKDVNEFARWRINVDLWESLVGHMERMQKRMESVGTGTEPHHMGSPPSPSQVEKKPE